MADPTDTPNTDAPIATVPLGPSEIVAYVMALASVVNGVFGHDYGLSANAQALSLLVSGLVVLGSTIARALKHREAIRANAAVYTAQLEHVAAVVKPGSTDGPKKLSEGVRTLNKGVAEDAAKSGSSPS